MTLTGLFAILMMYGYSPVEAQVYTMLVERGRADEFACLSEIYEAESSWNPNAYGDRTIGGSYGLPQRHAPAHGAPDLPWPVADQVEWTLEYADERYGGICEGLAFRRIHGWW